MSTDSTGRVGVAISTTGDEHRLALLMACVAGWDGNLPAGSPLFITVDGDEAACERVLNTVKHWTGSVYRVGQPIWPYSLEAPDAKPEIRDGRLGVATNKNTGIELLMDNVGSPPVEHLFLSDDDFWPLFPEALDLHVSGNTQPTRSLHSMVCWGSHRLLGFDDESASWSWPRGSMLYARREVVETVGGMVEAFGPGGHEHVEWSRRIHQAGLTPALYPSPRAYAGTDEHGHRAMGARSYWYGEDMPRDGESRDQWHRRKEAVTSVRRQPKDWRKIEQLMVDLDGDTSFKPYRAGENRRASATLYPNRRA